MKAYRMWRMMSRGKRHTVEMHHSWLTNRLQVVVNDEVVTDVLRDMIPVTAHDILYKHTPIASLTISAWGLECYYELSVNNTPVAMDYDDETLMRASINPDAPDAQLLRATTITPELEKAELLRAAPAGSNAQADAQGPVQ